MFKRKHWKIHNIFGSNTKNVTRIDKNGAETTKALSYRLKFIDSAIFMESLLPSIVNNFSEMKNTNMILKNLQN